MTPEIPAQYAYVKKKPSVCPHCDPRSSESRTGTLTGTRTSPSIRLQWVNSYEFARPVVGAGARFHSDQARRQVVEEGHQRVAPDLLLADGVAVRIDAVDLEYVLG